MSYSLDICNRITRFLDTYDWKYDLDREKEVIRSGLRLSNKMRHVSILFDLRDDLYLLFFTYPLCAGEEEKAEVRDLINRINYSILFGCFEMDDRDGEIRFRYSVDCEGVSPSQEVIGNSIYRSASTLEKYSDAFVQVIMGVAGAEEAYERARKQDG